MKLRHSMRGSQQGSIIVTTAIALSLIVILLIGSELGYLFFLKRELQKTADLAALAGATSVTTGDCSAGRAAALANANTASTGNMPTGLLPLANGEVTCGRWTSAGTVTDPASRYTSATTNLNAVQVQFSRTPASLLAFFTGSRTIAVHAVAAKALPAAQLSIRSTLLSVDSSQSPILNSVFGGLLGGSLNLTALSWDGLAKSNINLLSYLDALAVRLNVSAGQYDKVLTTNATAGQLLQAAVDALTKDGSVDGAIAVLNALISASANVSGVALQLGQLLGLQTGTSAAALNTTLQAFQLAEGIVQLANGKSSVYATTAITVPGIAGVTVATKVIEPPQLSAIGNPELAKADPMGTNRIYVRTAQTRSLISVTINSALTSIASGLATAVTNAVEPVTSLLNNLLSLNLVGALTDLSCVLYCEQQKQFTDIKILPSPIRIDVNLEVASGSSYVADYSCGTSDSKTLSAPVKTAGGEIRIGKIGATAAQAITNAFSSSSPPPVSPIPLIDIGAYTVKKTCTLAILCSVTWKKGNSWVSEMSQADRTAYAGGGIALSTDIPLLASSDTLLFSAPLTSGLPELNDASTATPYKAVSSQNVVNSLSGSLAGATIQTYKPSAAGGIGDLLVGVGTTLNAVIGLLQTAVSTVLSPLLDPLVNYLLQALGVNLAKTEVGARMTCSRGAELVY